MTVGINLPAGLPGQSEKIKLAKRKLSAASQIYQKIEAKKDQTAVIEKINEIEHI